MGGRERETSEILISLRTNKKYLLEHKLYKLTQASQVINLLFFVANVKVLNNVENFQGGL